MFIDVVAVEETETRKVRVGDSSFLLCERHSNSLRAYSWTKDDDPVTATTIGIDSTSINRNRLTITRMSQELIGIYQCFYMDETIKTIQLYIVGKLIYRYVLCKYECVLCVIVRARTHTHAHTTHTHTLTHTHTHTYV